MKSSFGKIDIIYEDDDIIIINKPHGLHSIDDRNKEQTETVRSILSKEYGNIFIVHRLDAGTGGLMLCAKNAGAHSNLNRQFENKTVYKEYTAIVTGCFKYPFTIMLPISAKPAHGKFKVNFKSGKDAQTSFIPVFTSDKTSVVKAIPHTGRTHQIRVHLKVLKHPLIADWVYNPPAESRNLTLFADVLSFTHPVTNKEMKFEITLSEFMKGFITE